MYVEGGIVLSRIIELVLYEELKGGSAGVVSRIKLKAVRGASILH